MVFEKEFNRSTEWLLCGIASLALHSVILGLFFFAGTGPSKPADADAPKTSASNAEVERKESYEPIPDDEMVPGVTAAAAPAVPEAAKKTEIKPSKSPAVAAKKSEKPTAKPKPAATAKTPPVPAASKTKDAAGDKTESYVVQKGDTLTAIAKNCGCTLPELAKLNGVTLKALSDLKVGQKIKVKAKLEGADAQ